MGVTGTGGLSAQSRANLFFIHEGSVHWTPVGDFEKALFLVVIERAHDLDVALDLIDQPRLRLAIGAVLGVHPVMAQSNRYLLQWPLLSLRVHVERHGGASAEGRQQKVVGVGSPVAASHAARFVGEEVVIARGDVSEESPGALFDVNLAVGCVGRVVVGRGQVAVGPGGQDSGDVLGVLGPGQQVVGVVEVRTTPTTNRTSTPCLLSLERSPLRSSASERYCGWIRGPGH